MKKPERLYLCWRCEQVFKGFLYRKPSGCLRCHRADWKVEAGDILYDIGGWPLLSYMQDEVDVKNEKDFAEWLMTDKGIESMLPGDIVFVEHRETEIIADMLEALKATVKVLKAIESEPAAALGLNVVCDAIQVTIDKAEGRDK